MLIAMTLLAVASIEFTEQSLPGLWIGPAVPFTGKPATNYLQADLDGDGAADLVIPGTVCFQRQGRFPEDERVPWPPLEPGAEADLFGNALYVRTPDMLHVLTRSDGRWHEQLAQPLFWPGARPQSSPRSIGEQLPQFRRFVHDLDGDNTPELVDLDSQGLHIFRMKRGVYEAAGVLDALPSMTLAPAATQAIWPAESRRIVLPEQEMSCRLLILRNALSLITQTETPAGVQFRHDAIQLKTMTDGAFAESHRANVVSEPLPSHLRPCHLNADDTLDFAGGRWLLSTASPLPAPIYETWASLDGGATFHIERSPAFQHFRPACSFLDFDGDGDLDMITESTRLYTGGTRETINRYLTETRLPHTVRILAQDQGSYATNDVLTFDLEIELDSPPVTGGAMLSRYQAGTLVNLLGDFNGDGYHDLAVRRSSTSLVIYLARGWHGFKSTPDATVSMPADADFGVADINGDGRADLLLHWEEPATGTESGAEQMMVYYSRQVAP